MLFLKNGIIMSVPIPKILSLYIEKSIEITKKLKSMNVDIQTIVESTGLTKEEIEKL